MIKAGTIIKGPHRQGYRILRDIPQYAVVKAEDFEAFGGAPESKAYTEMPKWLVDFIKSPNR